MTILIDRKYLMIISNKLPKFHQKKQDLYNFRCPICHDSEKNKNKCRGYIYRKKDNQKMKKRKQKRKALKRKKERKKGIRKC